MRSNVIDIRTGKTLFSTCVKGRINDGLRPFMKEGVEPEIATTAVEQVLCTAIVGCARDVASKLAAKFIEKFTVPKE